MRSDFSLINVLCNYTACSFVWIIIFNRVENISGEASVRIFQKILFCSGRNQRHKSVTRKIEHSGSFSA